MAVVFPAPAGAIASCRRAPEVHIWRTSAACPASSAVPFAAISSRARSTAACSTDAPPRRPAAATRRARRRGSAARCRGRRRRRCRPTTRRPAATPPVPRCRRAARPGQQTDDRAPHRPAGPPRHSACSAVTSVVRTCRCASARTCHICQVERLASITAQDVISRLCDPVGVGDRGGLGGRCQRRLHHRRDGAQRPPSTAAASLSQVARCSARDRGSCLASRVSNVACCARCNASTGVGGRP